jgi:hypothetical protein
MNAHTDKSAAETATGARPEPFAALRQHNERHSYVAKVLKAEREQHVERVVQAQRARRRDQAR